MSKVIRKFEDHTETILDAVEGKLDLRENNKLYKKLYRYYTKEGVIFTGESQVDYNMIINYLYEDFLLN